MDLELQNRGRHDGEQQRAGHYANGEPRPETDRSDGDEPSASGEVLLENPDLKSQTEKEGLFAARVVGEAPSGHRKRGQRNGVGTEHPGRCCAAGAKAIFDAPREPAVARWRPW